MPQADSKAAAQIAELKDELKQRDRRIAELRDELDEARELIRKFEEHADDYNACIERWKEALGMEETGDGAWTWKTFWEQRSELIADYNDLARRWNKYLPLINQRHQPVGRPLAASEAQCDQVRKLRRARKSLRWIAEETNLGLNTVRTILDKDHGADRTTKKHRERIDTGPVVREWKARKRVGDTLPKQAQRVVEEGHKLIRQAKGLGKGI